MGEKKKEKKDTAGKAGRKIDKNRGREWKKPTLEDVSAHVMAQPYIRFT